MDEILTLGKPSNDGENLWKVVLGGKYPDVEKITTMGCKLALGKKGARGSDPCRICGVGPLSARASRKMNVQSMQKGASPSLSG